MIQSRTIYLLKLLVLLFLGINLSSCSYFLGVQSKKSFKKRLKVIESKTWSLGEGVEVYWNEVGVPYIYAKTDKDLFYTTGLLQGFLRQSQLEVFRYLSQGRLSELVGKKAHNIDILIRTVDHGRAVEEMLYFLNEEERMVLTSFVEGLNDFNEKSRKLPIDLKILGIKKIKPWTVEELLRVHRFTSSDVNWMIWPRFLKIVEEEGFDQFWDSWVKNIKVAVSHNKSFLDEGVFSYTSDMGSNAFVIGKAKSYSKKAPIVGGDPHLGLMVPNLWFQMGQFSPSYNTLGVFMPGIPVAVMGKNKDLAWTGTNMWGLSSYFFKLNEDEVKNLKQRKEVIKTRWGKERVIFVRESRKGPVISDTKIFSSKKPIALSWTGHSGSNEIGSFIKANKSKSVDEFIKSFDDYGQVALNFVVADKKNNMAKVHVLKQPVLNTNEDRSLLQESNNFVKKFNTSKDFPVKKNPKTEVLVSANEYVDFDPVPTWFNPPDYRKKRLSRILNSKFSFTMDELKKVQTDVFLEISKKIVFFWETEFKIKKVSQPNFLKELLKWSFKYEENLKEPYIFEELASSFAKSVFKLKGLNKAKIKVLLSHSSWKDKMLDAYKTLNKKSQLDLINELKTVYDNLDKTKKWGDVHRLKLSHPLSKAPYIGKYFNFYEGGYPGGNETLFKAAHKNGEEGDYSTKFGANLRLLYDLSDDDENYTCLLGGQDGYLSSEHTFDQFDAWMKGKYFKTLYKRESVIKASKHKTVLNSL